LWARPGDQTRQDQEQLHEVKEMKQTQTQRGKKIQREGVRERKKRNREKK